MADDCTEDSGFSMNFSGAGMLASRCWVQEINGVLHYCCYIGGRKICKPMFKVSEIRTEAPPDPDEDLYKAC